MLRSSGGSSVSGEFSILWMINTGRTCRTYRRDVPLWPLPFPVHTTLSRGFVGATSGACLVADVVRVFGKVEREFRQTRELSAEEERTSRPRNLGVHMLLYLTSQLTPATSQLQPPTPQASQFPLHPDLRRRDPSSSLCPQTISSAASAASLPALLHSHSHSPRPQENSS